MPLVVSVLLWCMMLSQMLSVAWFSHKGGVLSDRGFLVFSICGVLGLTSTMIETYNTGAWRSLSIQCCFFTLTAWGGIQRYRKMRATGT